MAEQLKLMTREQVNEVLKPTEGLTHVDVELGSTKDIFFKSDEKDGGVALVTLPDGEHRMTSNGLFEAARGVGIPESYSKKCPLPLLFQNLDHWYRGGNSKGKLRFFLQKGVVVGVNANHPQYYNTSQFLDEVEAVVGKDHVLGYHQVNSSLQFSRVGVVTDQIFEVATGDLLHGGVDIQNCIIGEFKIQVAPYIFRQWCSNGAIASDNISDWSHRSDGESPIEPWVRNATSSAIQGLGAEFERIRHLTEISVEGHIPDTLASIFRKFGISVRMKQEIVEEAASQNGGAGPRNMYDIWNAITRVGTYSPRLSRQGARSLQMTAGEITKENSLCPSCHRIMHKTNA